MALSSQPYKGTRDFYPKDMRFRRWMFGVMHEVAQSYGYAEYDGPMLEPFDLYAAKTGEEIVNNQLYWLMDRGERKLAVRPEMTPTLARLVAQKIHELPRPVRLYSIPNLWRYERPQKGRLREHWQLNVDVLGGDPLFADVEVLKLGFDLVKKFKGEQFVSIRVNNRKLMDHFFSQKLSLPGDVALKITKLLDARSKMGDEAYFTEITKLGVSGDKVTEMESFFKSSLEALEKSCPCEGVTELVSLFKMLSESGLKDQVVFDPMILRGMDYYTGTVFEMYDISPENRRAMFGGGRYDNLVGLFGNHKLSGVGFGFGDVTLQHFLEIHNLVPTWSHAVDVFVSLPKKELRSVSEDISNQLRESGFKVMTPLEEGGFAAQLKMASKHEAHFAVLIGETELADKKVVVKDLIKGSQETVAIAQIAEYLRGL